MTEQERVKHEDEAWLAYKTARARLRKTTCPLQRVVLEVQVDSQLMAFMVWSFTSPGWGVDHKECVAERHKFLGDVLAYWGE